MAPASKGALLNIHYYYYLWCSHIRDIYSALIMTGMCHHVNLTTVFSEHNIPEVYHFQDISIEKLV